VSENSMQVSVGDRVVVLEAHQRLGRLVAEVTGITGSVAPFHYHLRIVWTGEEVLLRGDEIVPEWYYQEILAGRGRGPLFRKAGEAS
jgi:hypothetical protein